MRPVAAASFRQPALSVAISRPIMEPSSMKRPSSVRLSVSRPSKVAAKESLTSVRVGNPKQHGECFAENQFEWRQQILPLPPPLAWVDGKTPVAEPPSADVTDPVIGLFDEPLVWSRKPDTATALQTKLDSAEVICRTLRGVPRAKPVAVQLPRVSGRITQTSFDKYLEIYENNQECILAQLETTLEEGALTRAALWQLEEWFSTIMEPKPKCPEDVEDWKVRLAEQKITKISTYCLPQAREIMLKR